jgi:hypothetical protein
MRMLVAAGLAFCATIVPAWAQGDGEPDIKPLSGTFYIGPAIDTEDPKAPADHLYLTLTGDAAKAMWDAMKVKEEPDECVGRMARWVKSMVCYGPASPQSDGLAPDDSPFECYLGIDLKTAALESGGDC